MNFLEDILYGMRLNCRRSGWTPVLLLIGLCSAGCMESPIIRALEESQSGDEEYPILWNAAALAAASGSSAAGGNSCNPGLSGTLIFTCSKNFQLDICAADLSSAYCGFQDRPTVDSVNLSEVPGLYLPTVRDDSFPYYDSQSGRIYFQSRRDHTSQFSLYSMMPDGTSVERMGSDYVDARSLARKGDYLYVDCLHDPINVPGSGLCRYDVDTGQRELLLADDASGSLSELDAGNGSRVYFYRSTERYLKYWDTGTDSLHDLPAYDDLGKLVVAADDTLFFERIIGTTQIFRANPPDPMVQLTFPQEPGFSNYSLSVSPGGSYFTIRTSYPPEPGVWLYSSDGTRIAHLIDHPHYSTRGWSYDDQYVILGTDSSMIRIYNTETFEENQITFSNGLPAGSAGQMLWLP